MRRQQPEAQIQRAVFQHIRQRGVPGLFAFHAPNGGYRKPKEAAIFKGLGVVAGVPDVILIHGGRIYGMEIKPKDGRWPTARQLETMNAMHDAGAEVNVVFGLDEAVTQLEDWGLLRGMMQ